MCRNSTHVHTLLDGYTQAVLRVYLGIVTVQEGCPIQESQRLGSLCPTGCGWDLCDRLWVEQVSTPDFLPAGVAWPWVQAVQPREAAAWDSAGARQPGACSSFSALPRCVWRAGRRTGFWGAGGKDGHAQESQRTRLGRMEVGVWGMWAFPKATWGRQRWIGVGQVLWGPPHWCSNIF